MSLTCRNCSSNVHDCASLFRAMDGEWTSLGWPPDIGVSPEWLDFGDKSVAIACRCADASDTAAMPGGCCSDDWWCCSGDCCADKPGCWYTRCWSIGAIRREPDANCLASWLSVSRSSRCEKPNTSVGHFRKSIGLTKRYLISRLNLINTLRLVTA